MKRPRHTRRYRRRTVRVRVEYEAAQGRRGATATTLGAGGMFVATQEPLPVRALTVLRFRVTPGGHTHEIEGRVVWVNRPDVAEAPAAGMGIEFTDPAACARLARDLEGIASAVPAKPDAPEAGGDGHAA